LSFRVPGGKGSSFGAGWGAVCLHRREFRPDEVTDNPCSFRALRVATAVADCPFQFNRISRFQFTINLIAAYACQMRLVATISSKMSQNHVNSHRHGPAFQRQEVGLFCDC
jgi:hypothetical protein